MDYVTKVRDLIGLLYLSLSYMETVSGNCFQGNFTLVQTLIESIIVLLCEIPRGLCSDNFKATLLSADLH